MKKITFFMLFGLLLFSNFSFDDSKHEYMAKFIVSLVRYIQWPEKMNEGNFKIGIYGSFDMYKAISNQTLDIGIQNRNVDIMNLSKIDDVNLTPLHMLIITDANCTPENIRKAINLTAKSATIIVTDKEVATKYGAGINFVSRNNKLAYELHKPNCRRNGILISKQAEFYAHTVIE
ncbi:MAG: YfiR family protein [Bacteroidales bacterium]|nr:YfiR family protein [Bacteroidales bacterium]MBN2820959.1 YfiR family protein [Bacteroidales bacterium]